MIQRKLAVCLMVGVFAFAAASVMTIHTVKGSGKTLDGQGRRGEFSVDATKIIHRHEENRRGKFDFMARHGDYHIRIRVEAIDGMEVLENTGRLGGPAVMRVQRGTETKYFRGRGYFVGISNRHQEEEGDRDVVAVHFVPNVNTDPPFSYEGRVVQGDVGVSTTKSY
ncbi:MAG: hypothetical protein HZC36_11325 [Armatimonadetes bacterium]|nr:hypothetical protein [Armatimonadota bacterium]